MSRVVSQNKNLKREFAKYAIPSVTGMMVSFLYNVVDGIFVGRGVGEDALAAINIAFPFLMLQIAITMLFAIGGANAFSVNRGRGDDETANAFFRQSIYLLAGIGILLNVCVILFTPQVAKLLGADDTLLPYVCDYIKWIAAFAIIQTPGMGIGMFIRNDNAPRLELLGTLSGTVVNIVLDYLFIMVFNMGMAGAAIATGIGQTASVAIVMTHFLKKDRVLRFGKAKWSGRDIKKILFTGFPSFLMEFSQSAIAFSFNLVLMANIGKAAVSAYSAVMYICAIFNMVLIGLVQGAQPLMSFYYGSGNRENVQKLYKMGVKVSLCATVIIYGVLFFLGDVLTQAFIPNNAKIVEMAQDMMRIYFLAYFPIGISLFNILFFQVTEKETRSILISFLRCFGFVQLFLFFLPGIAGDLGIYLSYPCGELCICILSAMLYRNAKKADLSIRINTGILEN